MKMEKTTVWKVSIEFVVTVEPGDQTPDNWNPETAFDQGFFLDMKAVELVEKNDGGEK
tara:strand:+ start:305 stop:478 length:174 start_codon:yes stop_codon:yes gene_type:complete